MEIKHLTFYPQGVCSRQFDIDYDTQGTIHKLEITGGCHGHTQAMCRLLEGEKASTMAAKICGIDCKGKGTSCPDQLSKALRQISAELG